MMVHCFEQWELIPDQGPLEQRSASLPPKEAADQEHQERGTLSTLYVIGLEGRFQGKKSLWLPCPIIFSFSRLHQLQGWGKLGKLS